MFALSASWLRPTKVSQLGVNHCQWGIVDEIERLCGNVAEITAWVAI